MGLLDDVKRNAAQIKDKASDLVHEHGDQIEKGIDKAGEALSKATKGKYDGTIDKGVSAAKDGVDKLDKKPGPGTTPGA